MTTNSNAVTLPEGAPIFFGPEGTTTEQLQLPSTFTRTVDYTDQGFKAEYVFAFNGQTLTPNSMTVASTSGSNGLTTRDLTQLQIPDIMREAVYFYNPTLATSLKGEDKTTDNLARLYWAEFVCNASPRKVIMNLMGWSRTNANYHLSKFAKAGLIPLDRTR